MKKRFAIITLILSITLGVFLWGGHTLFASFGGYTGGSGSPTSGITCSTCHQGGIEPDVMFVGSGIAAPGELLTYTLLISGGQEAGGGFNVDVEGGALSILPGAMDVRESSGELTHTEPKAANMNGEVEFTFNWTAPITPGTAVLYGAGNSVNLNGQNSGDAASQTTLTVAIGTFSETVNLPVIINATP